MSDDMATGLREVFASGRPLLGTFLFLPSEDAAEAIAGTGMDFVIVDMEHSPKDWRTVANMLRGAALGGTPGIVRVPALADEHVLHALESGADGVMVPFVQGREDVRRLVRAARYTPVGARGTCTMARAAGYGSRVDGFVEAAAEANNRVALLGIVESLAGLRALPEIVAEDPGLDAVMIGQADLASDLGHPGMTTHPAVIGAIEEALAGLGEPRIPIGIGTNDVDECRQWAGRGARVFVHSTDVGVMLAGYRDTAAGFAALVEQDQESDS